MYSSLLFLFLLLATTRSQAAPPIYWDTELESVEARTRYFSHNEGLPEGTIRAIVQTQDNAILFAGQQGITRYDGYTWATDSLQAPALQRIRSGINDIIESRDGSIWIGTDLGVARFQNGIWKAFTQKDGLPGPCITSLYEDNKGRIWVGSGTLKWHTKIPPGGVAYWNGSTWTAFTENDGLVNQHVNTIYQSRNGHIWVGTDGGVGFYDGKKWDNLTQADGLLFNVIHAIHQDKTGAMWFGSEDTTATAKNGLTKYQNKQMTTYQLPIEKWGVRSIAQTQDDVLWALGGYDVYHLKEGEWQKTGIQIQGTDYVNKMCITSKDVMWIPGERVSKIAYGNKWISYKKSVLGPPYQDPTGTLWFKNARGGTWSWQNNTWSDHPDISWPVIKTEENIIWTSGPQGIRSYDGQQWQHHPNKLDSLLSIHRIKNNGHLLFIGVRDKLSAVAIYTGSNWETYTENDWSPGVILNHTLIQSPNGDIWFKPYFRTRLNGFGLIRFSPQYKTWQKYIMESNQEASNRVYGLSSDQNAHIWAGTLNGLWIFDGTNWEKEIDLQNRKITRVHKSNNNTMWLTCAYKPNAQAGVLKYANGKWSNYTEEDGLISNDVWVITETQNGNFWFGTRDGASYFDGANWQNFTTDDGLLMNNTRFIFEDADQSVWFGRGHHYRDTTRWWTTQYIPNTDPPKTHFTFTPGKELAKGNLIIEWQGKDKWQDTPSSKLTYSWKINGGSWQPFSTETKTVFFDLPSGSHTFQVRSKDQDGNIETSAQMYSFYVIAPIWAQPWFITLITLLLGTIAYLSIRVIKRGQALSLSNKALSDANKQLFATNQSLKSEISERERLDTQIQSLQYLYNLRAALSDTYTTSETLQTVGLAILDLLGPTSGIIIALDDQSYEFGQPIDPAQQYKRNLNWGERLRGSFILKSPFTLSESQERTLLDETTGQLVRVLEARELQMQLLQSSRLISLGQMAAGVAHELNQPLGGISATAEDYYLRLQDNMPVSNDQLKDLFKRVLGMVDRMSNTVEHLRIFSRDTSQEPGTPLHINDVIHSSLDIIGTQLKNHGIEMILELTKDLPQITGHPYQLEQIFLNLLGNARDALDTSTQTKNLFKTITISTQKDANIIIVKVQDNGEGIDTEHLNHIFEPFYTTKPADKGTGLGLSITYAIVKNHNGNISCVSRKGHGTTFEVRFPTSTS